MKLTDKQLIENYELDSRSSEYRDNFIKGYRKGQKKYLCGVIKRMLSDTTYTDQILENFAVKHGMSKNKFKKILLKTRSK